MIKGGHPSLYQNITLQNEELNITWTFKKIATNALSQQHGEQINHPDHMNNDFITNFSELGDVIMIQFNGTNSRSNVYHQNCQGWNMSS